MRVAAKKMFLLLMSAVILLTLLCSCGSRLDGTWQSASDSGTKITFSGRKVKVSYGKFKLNGTYVADEEDKSLITMELTDEKGNIYRIVARTRLDTADKDRLTLINPDTGTEEVFEK
jgi:hypothetical protein